MRFAAIDFGGSFIKSAVVDTAAPDARHVRRDPFPPFLSGLDPSFREVAMAPIAEIFSGRLDELLDAEPECAGVLVSTQMHGFALVDGDGRAATNFISWQDQRSLRTFPEFEERCSPAARERIGNEIGPGHAASVLHAMVRSGTVRRGDRLAPVPLPNALLGAEPSADVTLAASFGVLDVRRAAWDSELIAALGLDGFAWPRITHPRDIVGHYRRIPVYSPIGDQQAALLGAHLGGGELSINIGTGSQVSALSDTFDSGPFKVRPWLDGRFLKTITHLPAGRALNLLRRMTRAEWQEIDRAVEALPATDLAVDLSFFHGAVGRSGRIENIREGNFSLGDLFLAAYENMASNYAAAAERLFPGGNWPPLVLSGGLAHRAGRLRELIAARFGREFRLSVSEDETLEGLRRLWHS